MQTAKGSFKQKTKVFFAISRATFCSITGVNRDGTMDKTLFLSEKLRFEKN